MPSSRALRGPRRLLHLPLGLALLSGCSRSEPVVPSPSPEQPAQAAQTTPGVPALDELGPVAALAYVKAEEAAGRDSAALSLLEVRALLASDEVLVAKAVLDIAVAQHPGDEDLAVEQHMLEQHIADLTELVTTLQQLVGQPGAPPSLDADLGQALLGLGYRDLARPHLVAAVATDPGDLDSREALARVRVAEGEVDAAVELLEAGAELHPLGHCALGRVLVEHTEHDALGAGALATCLGAGGQLAPWERALVEAPVGSTSGPPGAIPETGAGGESGG